ncbi:MAG TPA: polyribonucleotide nucleotidyltransferase [Acholeplasmatales bacterium]|nr:MAG: polyribonucleotide nucleotidyltransferase [Tenericutes bacterium GWF2_57_13]HAQ56355.1 polyribonucleotide nucleotidyltransferase [Acholeplasmatales bacterium]
MSETNEKKVYTLEFFGRELKVEVGQLAKQANGAALVRFGDSAVLSVAVVGEPKDYDYFPLMVLYQEKMYSVGKIPGGFFRREGRPSEHETLNARAIDRPLRPLFDENFRNDVQVINTVMSVNPDNSPEIAALLGSSLALGLGGVPFHGPVAMVNIARVNGQLICCPTVEEALQSDIDLTIAGTKFAVNMVEAGAKQVSEADILDAIMYGHEQIKTLVAFQEQIIAENAKPMIEVTYQTVPAEIDEAVRALDAGRIVKAVVIQEKLERGDAIEAINEEIRTTLEAQYKAQGVDKDDIVKNLFFINRVLEAILVAEVRRLITEDKIRPDGRGCDEIRPLAAEIDLFERTHGSALFTRGQTQVFAATTLGPLRDSQLIEGVTLEDGKRFMLHYNFPQFSVGSTGRYGSPGRREIGHGALGERALLQVIPSEDEFPYAIRVVSEVLESNGSSSQATICSGSMSLMAAGVPIKAAVAGIAMGLVKNGDKVTILTDIQGLEDHFGDMDFKIAGTKDGVTAIQMDIKVDGISREIMQEALEQARKGRLQILDVMLAAIPAPRKELSKYAPKVKIMRINVDKIRDVIGPGGKIIQSIVEKCNQVKIDIEQDGRVIFMHTDVYWIDQAMKLVAEIVREVQVGEIFTGKVVRIEKFGCFIELWPGQDGLCHISKLAEKRVERVEDVVKLGDMITVKVTEIDEKGRVDLSRKAILESLKK